MKWNKWFCTNLFIQLHIINIIHICTSMYACIVRKDTLLNKIVKPLFFHLSCEFSLMSMLSTVEFPPVLKIHWTKREKIMYTTVMFYRWDCTARLITAHAIGYIRPAASPWRAGYWSSSGQPSQTEDQISQTLKVNNLRLQTRYIRLEVNDLRLQTRYIRL